jgi:lysophospholipase L1-like esterase
VQSPREVKWHFSEVQLIASNKKYLALGDSYTIGEDVSEAERWPNQLVDMLRSANVVIKNPTIIAKTSWTTGDLLEAINAAAPPPDFDFVSLLIGVNNQYRGLPSSQYRSEFIDLVERAISFTRSDPKRVVVLSIPDWSLTPFASDRDQSNISQEIDRFNEVNQAEAAKQRVKYFDITKITRSLSADLTMLASDGLHPSGKMYKVWAELIYSYFLR